MKTLIVAPMRREARAIGRSAVSVGAGPASADALRLLLTRSPDIRAMVIAGICGALDPSLAAGRVVLASSVVAAGKPDLRADAGLLDAAQSALAGAHALARPRREAPQAAVIYGSVVTVPSPALNVADRTNLRRDAGAAAVDMETYWLAVAAAECRVPWIAVRAVSDTANARLPAAIGSWRDERDDWRVALAIARRPQDWLAAARLMRDTGLALRSLSRAVSAIASALERIAPPVADA